MNSTWCWRRAPRILLGDLETYSSVRAPPVWRSTGFDTAVFELKGSADKPQLRYLPAESLMTGVKGTAQLAFDILVNAITLPQKPSRLWKKV